MVGRCALCGGPLPPKKFGNPRIYCSTRCKNKVAARRSRERGPVEEDPFLPIEPFRAYLLGRLKAYDDSVFRMAMAMGIHDRAIRRFFDKRTKQVHVSTVDNLLTAEGRMTLYELYPDHRPTGEEE